MSGASWNLSVRVLEQNVTPQRTRHCHLGTIKNDAERQYDKLHVDTEP